MAAPRGQESQSVVSVVVRRHRNGWWQYDITGDYPDGEPYRERRKSPLSSASATHKFAEERERFLHDSWKERRQAARRAPTWGDAWTQYMAHSRIKKRNEESTLEWKGKLNTLYIEPAIGAKTPIDKIDDKVIELVVSQMGKDAKPKSVNHVLQCIRGVLGLAQRRKQIVFLPDLDPQKVPESEPRHLEVADFETHLAACEKLERQGVWQPLAVTLLGADCGLRRGEMAALQRKDLDFAGKRIFIRHSLWKGQLRPTKGKRIRVVAMSTRIADLLRRRRHLRSPFVFVRENGKPVSAETIARWFLAGARHAGIKLHGQVHVLRHTLGSHLAEAGVDLHRIQEILGHADQKTTEIYARIAARRATEALETVELYRRKHAGNKSAGDREKQ
jgi:integrase